MSRTLMLLAGFLLLLNEQRILAHDFHLNSPYNKETFRFEIDNDTVWNKDSDFSNGWSLQYHTICYDAWDDTAAPRELKWIGNHFPTLMQDDLIVRFGYGLGQNMITPGDLTSPLYNEGDLPYAGTLTFSFNWQAFNSHTARIFQVTGGILGQESFAESFQKVFHKNLVNADDPMGWDTQRKSEPVVNVAYTHFWRLAQAGVYTNGWAGQLFGAPMVYVGNLITGVDVVVGGRWGWNIPEGFYASPAPPGYGFFIHSMVPKPAAASPHGFELTLSGKVLWMYYSAFFDGSIITNDHRNVDRNDYTIAAMAGMNYHYYDFFSLRLAVVYETDLLVEESIPVARPGSTKTGANNSYGALIVDFYF